MSGCNADPVFKTFLRASARHVTSINMSSNTNITSTLHQGVATFPKTPKRPKAVIQAFEFQYVIHAADHF